MIDKQIVEQIDEILDERVDNAYQVQPLAQDWARVCKVIEELGEAVTELIAYTGQNPRKPKSKVARELMLSELGDVVLTGVMAIQHFTKDANKTEEIVKAAQHKAISRLIVNGMNQ